MVINYVAHLDPFVYSGGGEVVSRTLLEWVQKKWSAKINITTLNPFQFAFSPKAEMTFFCDVFNNPTSLRKWPPGFLNWAMNQIPFVHLDNAYVDCCSMGYLPCSGQNKIRCEYKSAELFTERIRKINFSDYCDTQKLIVKLFYEKSKLNIFMSPLHEKTIRKMIGYSGDSYILKPLIDTEAFKNLHQKRDISHLFVGVVGEAKGLQNLKSMFANKKEKLTIVGKNISGENLDWAEYLGVLPYDQLPQIFNRAEKFVYLPRWPEPQGRVVVEAALCGCELVTNDMCGATSFQFDLSDPENLQNVEQDFWQNVKRVMQ